MVHTGPVPGEFTSDWKVSPEPCRKCGGVIRYKEWESSCGGYDDYWLKCSGCDYSYWVEGPDA